MTDPIKLNIALFKDEKPDSKTHFYGVLSLKEEDLDLLNKYVKTAEKDSYGSAALRVAGWRKEAKNGKKYISAVASIPLDWLEKNQQQSAAAEPSTDDLF